jgi:hypothetical protein
MKAGARPSAVNLPPLPEAAIAAARRSEMPLPQATLTYPQDFE